MPPGNFIGNKNAKYFITPQSRLAVSWETTQETNRKQSIIYMETFYLLNTLNVSQWLLLINNYFKRDNLCQKLIQVRVLLLIKPMIL
jgi:hypothetical protein